MMNILLIGSAPLPEAAAQVRPAAGLRTWQFLKPLLRDGGLVAAGLDKAFSGVHKAEVFVHAFLVAMPESYQQEPEIKEFNLTKNCLQTVVSKNEPSLGRMLQEACDSLNPDLIISVNTYPSFLAATIQTDAPIWADLNGWVMSEAQAQAYKMDSNDYIGHYMEIEKTIIMRANAFSVVSNAQKYALIGELGISGRLTSENFGKDFIKVIPNATEEFEGEEAVEIGKETENFNIGWVGGYNTWVDEKTLFDGLIGAMRKHPNIKFISTGGGVKGLDTSTFGRFQKLVKECEFANRFEFLGWVQTHEIPSIYRRCHMGINVDLNCVETLTGARNRLNEMMKFGLPIVTTLGSEISYEVALHGAGIGVKNGDSEGITDAICEMYKEWNEGSIVNFSNAGKKYTKEIGSYENTMRPLLEAIEKRNFDFIPVVATDFGGIKAQIISAIRYLRERGLHQFIRKIRQKIGF